jgi:hypothetical protein
MAAKKIRRTRSQKSTKAPRKPASTRAQALAFVRTRIVQYECDLELLRALATQLEGTGGRASASARIVKGARAAGWL